MLGCWILFIAGAFFPAHNVYPAEMEILSTAGQAREGRAKDMVTSGFPMKRARNRSVLENPLVTVY